MKYARKPESTLSRRCFLGTVLTLTVAMSVIGCGDGPHNYGTTAASQPISVKTDTGMRDYLIYLYGLIKDHPEAESRSVASGPAAYNYDSVVLSGIAAQGTCRTVVSGQSAPSKFAQTNIGQIIQDKTPLGEFGEWYINPDGGITYTTAGTTDESGALKGTRVTTTYESFNNIGIKLQHKISLVLPLNIGFNPPR